MWWESLWWGRRTRVDVDFFLPFCCYRKTFAINSFKIRFCSSGVPQECPVLSYFWTIDISLSVGIKNIIIEREILLMLCNDYVWDQFQFTCQPLGSMQIYCVVGHCVLYGNKIGILQILIYSRGYKRVHGYWSRSQYYRPSNSKSAKASSWSMGKQIIALPKSTNFCAVMNHTKKLILFYMRVIQYCSSIFFVGSLVAISHDIMINLSVLEEFVFLHW